MHSPRTGPAKQAWYTPQKLYLNLEISQVGSQLLWRLIVNNGKAETARAFKIERAVVDEDTFFRLALSDGERDTENAFFRFARVDVARAKENLETFAKVESFDAVLIQFERFVVDGADEILFGLHYGIENGARAGIFFGLREHKGGEFFAGNFSGAVEQGAVEIFVDGNLTGIECGKAQVMAVLKFFPVEVKRIGGCLAGAAVPAVGEDDAADIPEECCDAWHRESSFRQG